MAEQDRGGLLLQGCNSNVHRGVHNLAARATAAYEGARAKVARFINAHSDREVVWCRNASEGINLVAYTWGLENLKPGDEVGRGAGQTMHWAGPESGGCACGACCTAGAPGCATCMGCHLC